MRKILRMEKIKHAKSNRHVKTGVFQLISGKQTLRQSSTRDKQGHFRKIKGSSHQEKHKNQTDLQDRQIGQD